MIPMDVALEKEKAHKQRKLVGLVCSPQRDNDSYVRGRLLGIHF